MLAQNIYLLSFSYIISKSNISKGSKLKPDAPEFVPTQTQTLSIDPSKSNPKDAAKIQKKRDREDRKAASLAKKAGKKAAKPLENPDGMVSVLPQHGTLTN